jgi:hypothetical protein
MPPTRCIPRTRALVHPLPHSHVLFICLFRPLCLVADLSTCVSLTFLLHVVSRVVVCNGCGGTLVVTLDAWPGASDTALYALTTLPPSLLQALDPRYVWSPWVGGYRQGRSAGREGLRMNARRGGGGRGRGRRGYAAPYVTSMGGKEGTIWWPPRLCMR